jgi:hypothetical protein
MRVATSRLTYVLVHGNLNAVQVVVVEDALGQKVAEMQQVISDVVATPIARQSIIRSVGSTHPSTLIINHIANKFKATHIHMDTAILYHNPTEQHNTHTRNGANVRGFLREDEVTGLGEQRADEGQCASVAIGDQQLLRVHFRFVAAGKERTYVLEMGVVSKRDVARYRQTDVKMKQHPTSYVCMYVCMFVCMYVYMYVCSYAMYACNYV